MAVTVTEASAINVVLRAVLDVPAPDGSTSTDTDLADACVVLAKAAHARLGAGVRPDQVKEWTDRG